jgi:hypothetical protein
MEASIAGPRSGMPRLVATDCRDQSNLKTYSIGPGQRHDWLRPVHRPQRRRRNHRRKWISTIPRLFASLLFVEKLVSNDRYQMDQHVIHHRSNVGASYYHLCTLAIPPLLVTPQKKKVPGTTSLRTTHLFHQFLSA